MGYLVGLCANLTLLLLGHLGAPYSRWEYEIFTGGGVVFSLGATDTALFLSLLLQMVFAYVSVNLHANSQLSLATSVFLFFCKALLVLGLFCQNALSIGSSQLLAALSISFVLISCTKISSDRLFRDAGFFAAQAISVLVFWAWSLRFSALPIDSISPQSDLWQSWPLLMSLFFLLPSFALFFFYKNLWAICPPPVFLILTAYFSVFLTQQLDVAASTWRELPLTALLPVLFWAICELVAAGLMLLVYRSASLSQRAYLSIQLSFVLLAISMGPADGFHVARMGALILLSGSTLVNAIQLLRGGQPIETLVRFFCFLGAAGFPGSVIYAFWGKEYDLALSLGGIWMVTFTFMGVLYIFLFLLLAKRILLAPNAPQSKDDSSVFWQNCLTYALSVSTLASAWLVVLLKKG